MRLEKTILHVDLDLKRVENQLVTVALAVTNGNRETAAALLGVSVRTLLRKIRERTETD